MDIDDQVLVSLAFDRRTRKLAIDQNSLGKKKEATTSSLMMVDSRK